MQLLRTENGLDRNHSSLWKRKSCPQNSERIRRMDCTVAPQLPGGLLSYRHQQDRKARRKKTSNFHYGSSLRWSVERFFGYQGDNLAGGSVRPSHESLQEKLLVSAVYQVLHWVIDKVAHLNGPGFVHTRFWIPIVIDDMKVAVCWVECTPVDDSIWNLSHFYHW